MHDEPLHVHDECRGGADGELLMKTKPHIYVFSFQAEADARAFAAELRAAGVKVVPPFHVESEGWCVSEDKGKPPKGVQVLMVSMDFRRQKAKAAA
jgi:hypothetical protein